MITRTLLAEIVDGLSVRYDYSGRGMYGKTCFALVGGYTTLTAFVAEVSRRFTEAELQDDDLDFYDALDAIVNGVAVDNLGRDLVFYWPRLVVVDE